MAFLIGRNQSRRITKISWEATITYVPRAMRPRRFCSLELGVQGTRVSVGCGYAILVDFCEGGVGCMEIIPSVRKRETPFFLQSLEAVGSMREGKIPGSDFEIFGERDMIVGRPVDTASTVPAVTSR